MKGNLSFSWFYGMSQVKQQDMSHVVVSTLLSLSLYLLCGLFTLLHSKYPPISSNLEHIFTQKKKCYGN